MRRLRWQDSAGRFAAMERHCFLGGQVLFAMGRPIHLPWWESNCCNKDPFPDKKEEDPAKNKGSIKGNFPQRHGKNQRRRVRMGHFAWTFRQLGLQPSIFAVKGILNLAHDSRLDSHGSKPLQASFPPPPPKSVLTNDVGFNACLHLCPMSAIYPSPLPFTHMDT